LNCFLTIFVMVHNVIYHVQHLLILLFHFNIAEYTFKGESPTDVRLILVS